jgi:hypothetical protein
VPVSAIFAGSDFMEVISKNNISIAFFYLILMTACHSAVEDKQPGDQRSVFKEGEFGYDLQFLSKLDSGLIVLTSGNSRVVISPKIREKFSRQLSMEIRV